MELKQRSGFTLIELMVVVAIIGILAAIAIPKFRDMMEKSRESATKGNLATIREAIANYNAAYNGDEPANINVAPFTGYLNPLPSVKVTHSFGGTKLSGRSNAVEIVNSTPGNSQGKGNAYGLTKFKASGDGWRYDPVSGGVWVNNSQTDTTGLEYTLYGYMK